MRRGSAWGASGCRSCSSAPRAPFRTVIRRQCRSSWISSWSYAIEIVTTLFGEVCLTRRWGRIGTLGLPVDFRAKTGSGDEEHVSTSKNRRSDLKTG
ncbi:WGR domain-containing protein [Ensifer adhaerens]|uniref:WGR domain-containing protein n=1 Tax=Ensifer adhaerens TaxID=106592 RepID=UPI001146E65A|nr:WGR domain-containing protein [Ensifer adhaerens]